jgi:hypothetical protein
MNIQQYVHVWRKIQLRLTLGLAPTQQLVQPPCVYASELDLSGEKNQDDGNISML